MPKAISIFVLILISQFSFAESFRLKLGEQRKIVAQGETTIMCGQPNEVVVSKSCYCQMDVDHNPDTPDGYKLVINFTYENQSTKQEVIKFPAHNEWDDQSDECESARKSRCQ